MIVVVVVAVFLCRIFILVVIRHTLKYLGQHFLLALSVITAVFVHIVFIIRLYVVVSAGDQSLTLSLVSTGTIATVVLGREVGLGLRLRVLFFFLFEFSGLKSNFRSILELFRSSVSFITISSILFLSTFSIFKIGAFTLIGSISICVVSSTGFFSWTFKMLFGFVSFGFDFTGISTRSALNKFELNVVLSLKVVVMVVGSAVVF
ncbi:hypothetical protein PUN28_008923 [Cardiocondyla obscurior]|uniref:Uncharacterized protein n=1 Tax=Cardiocondyla obscurior TaxID=286306 RepID=A0AAW2FRX6_9HYME